MLRCNRCGALWVVTHLTRRQKKALAAKHDLECAALAPVTEEGDKENGEHE